MDDAKQLHGTHPDACPAGQQKSAELRLEVQANQAVVEGLLNWCSVFAFTGGAIPSGQCRLVAVNSYLDSPFAADCILTEEVERYRFLAESIAMPPTEVPARPRTFRDRKRIADAFSEAASEVQRLGRKFELALMACGMNGKYEQKPD